jgi:hypothetical protein
MRLALALMALLAAAPAAAAADRPIRAGAAAVDASWHLGAPAGDKGSDGTPSAGPGGVRAVKSPAYGMQSRLSVRAIVFEGSNGRRWAVVKDDNFIPQDLLHRRTAQILEADGTSGITRANLTMAVTHDHSSPYLSSSGWGVFLSTDVFDARFYEYLAQRQARAVIKAARHMVPVRVGAATRDLRGLARNSMGGERTDDGTPGGYYADDVDTRLTVIRVDDVSKPGKPKPLANLVNFALHGEFLRGNDLISADFLGPLQRMLDRETGAVTVWTQGAVGTSEPTEQRYDQPFDAIEPVAERAEWHYRNYAQAEAGARRIADAVKAARRDVAGDGAAVAFMRTGDVLGDDRWLPGPASHPLPTFGNCKNEALLAGHPFLPTDVPTCAELGQSPVDPGLRLDDLKAAGLPVPDSVSYPAYTGLEEDLGVHLQAFAIGGILFTVCPCEQWKDQSLNIRSRTDREAGNEWLGYDFSADCNPVPGGWSCPDPFSPIRLGRVDLPVVSDAAYRRMKAEVNNDAAGWDDAAYVSQAESEPLDPALIKGNYTHDDDAESAARGWDLTVAMSMANDYNGYVPTYREYQNRDHYRKSLSGWGPHASDYMATRLVRMARRLHGGADLPVETGNPVLAAAMQAKVDASLAHNDVRAAALGQAGGLLADSYAAALPAEAGPPAVLAEPRDIERFSTAVVRWLGGSNFTDDPVVRVQRRTRRGGWRNFADQSGEVVTTVAFPEGPEARSFAEPGQRWEWTASFEAFVSRLGEATPADDYRFVVRGRSKAGAYRLTSAPFAVAPWSGITVEDRRVEDGGRLSVRVGPRHRFDVNAFEDEAGPQPPLTAEVGPIDYPDSSASPVRFIHERRTAIRDPDDPLNPAKVQWYCFDCSFRPWADTGDADTVLFGDVPGVRDGDRWVSSAAVPADVAVRVTDAYGNVNG